MIIYAYSIALSIIWVLNKPSIKLFNRKPFNCELCLTFWLFLLLKYDYSVCTIGDAALAALASPLILKLYNKLNVILLK